MNRSRRESAQRATTSKLRQHGFWIVDCLFELPVLRLLYGCGAGWIYVSGVYVVRRLPSFAAGEYLVGAGTLQARGASLSSVPVN